MAITWQGTIWTASTAYAVGDRVVNVGNVYRCTTAGTSAAAPAVGPTGTGTAITDGTVVWRYLGANGGAVTNVAPELASGVSAGSQAAYLNDVDVHVPTDGVWGDGRDMAACYLAAHLATIGKTRGHGPLTAQNVGPLSRSYGTLLQFGELGLTPYGVEYQRRVNTTAAVLGFVV